VIDIPQAFILNSKDTPFPDVNLALEEPNGLIAIGGELSTERLLNAYQKVFSLGIAKGSRCFGTAQILEWLSLKTSYTSQRAWPNY